jgi:hypothetical protein
MEGILNNSSADGKTKNNDKFHNVINKVMQWISYKKGGKCALQPISIYLKGLRGVSRSVKYPQTTNFVLSVILLSVKTSRVTTW